MSKSWEPYLKETLVDEVTLQARVAELGAEISRDYAGQDLVLVCVLKGAVLFLTDLIRHVDVPHEIDFLATSSYGRGARNSMGVVRILKDLDAPINDRHVVVVEDIIDTGYTLDYILRGLRARNPASVKICGLLDKRERRVVPIPIDYCGFVIPDKFVFGYGMDLDEKFRNLPFIGVAQAGG